MKNTRITLLIITTLSLFLITILPAHMVTANGVLAGRKICLDPGHGGSDPGAVYDDGTIYLEEADINLDVAYGLKALLEADGAEVVMTRTDDSSNSNSDRYTFANDEKATILVSIHTNSVNDPTMDGSLALYFHNDDKVLAQAIHDVMYPYLKGGAPDSDNFTDFGLDRYASGVLLKSNMPAAMMEPLFMSNPAEAKLLVTRVFLDNGVTPNPDCLDCRRAQIAQALHDGILAYFAPAEPGGVMHIGSIEMSLQQREPWTNALAAVLIVDTDGNPVAGATVTGDWTGSAIDTDVVTTDENGIATARSDRTRESTGTFTFTVGDVAKDGWPYDSGANAETDDFISF